MRRWLVLILLLAIAGVVLGRLFLKSWRGTDVTLAHVERGRVIAAVYATGRVDTDRRATVRVRVAAPLDTLSVGPGEVVGAGQVVARQSSAALHLATERLAREVEVAQATLAGAEDAAARAEKLVREALLADDAWVRAREAARELRAQVEVRRSALALAREQESWTVLTAPLAGTVAALLHRAGDNLREGDEVLTVVDLQPAYVRVAVDERDLGRIALGQGVRLVFDAYPGKLLDGAVWRLVPSIDRLTKSSDVLVRLPVERPALSLDMTATVNIVTGVIEDAVVVRRDALEGAGDARRVVVVDDARRAIRRAVTIGVCDERQCQIVAGLAPGDEVIAPLPAGLKEGARVRVR